MTEDSTTNRSEGIHRKALHLPGISFDTTDDERTRIFVLVTVNPTGLPEPTLDEPTAEAKQAERLRRAYEIWQAEAPDDPAYLGFLLRNP